MHSQTAVCQLCFDKRCLCFFGQRCIGSVKLLLLPPMCHPPSDTLWSPLQPLDREPLQHYEKLPMRPSMEDLLRLRAQLYSIRFGRQPHSTPDLQEGSERM